MNRRRRIVTAAFAVVVGLLTAPVAAQSDGYAFTGINFNFANPGARARGIGGAFVAIADDATAALANPAGIAYLGRVLSLEWAWDEERFPVGQLTQGGVGVVLEGTSMVYTPESDPDRVWAGSRQSRLNHFALVLPLVEYRLNLAVFYGVLGDLDASFRVGDGLTCIGRDGSVTLPGAGEPCTLDLTDPSSGDIPVLYFGQTVRYRLKTETAGVSIGWRLGDRWSLGATVAAGDTSLAARADIDRSAAGLDPRRELSSVDDRDLLFAAGILYRGERFGFGASWRSHSRYAIENRIGVVDPATGEVAWDQRFGSELTVPDRLAAGVTWFPGDRWVVAAEVTRIGYSELGSRMRAFDPVTEAYGIRYRTDDVTEYHLGAEYTTFEERAGWSVRAGWWRERTHPPYVSEPYTDPHGDAGDRTRAELSAVRAPYDRAVDHFTAGGGWATDRIRLDLAVDWSDLAGTDVMLSAVLYF